jgi:hypothetical protein
VDTDAIETVASDDLARTWLTLTAVARNYAMGSSGEACLVEARRLIEVEMRAQHGDEVWAALTSVR